MGEHKLNRRVQYTRTALREALIDLICEKAAGQYFCYGYLRGGLILTEALFTCTIRVSTSCLVKLKTKLLRKSKSTSCARPLWIRSTLWSLS